MEEDINQNTVIEWSTEEIEEQIKKLDDALNSKKEANIRSDRPSLPVKTDE